MWTGSEVKPGEKNWAIVPNIHACCPFTAVIILQRCVAPQNIQYIHSEHNHNHKKLHSTRKHNDCRPQSGGVPWCWCCRGLFTAGAPPVWQDTGQALFPLCLSPVAFGSRWCSRRNVPRPLPDAVTRISPRQQVRFFHRHVQSGSRPLAAERWGCWRNFEEEVRKRLTEEAVSIWILPTLFLNGHFSVVWWNNEETSQSSRKLLGQKNWNKMLRC